MKQISIIVRTSTRYILLNRTIKDIQQQTFKNWKIILVNDGGDKKKIQCILDNNHLLPEQYSFIQSEKNMGLHKSINLGVDAIETKYVVVHDDDDTWNKTFLHETVSYLETNQNCYGVITHSNKIYEKIENNEVKVKKIKPFNYQLKGVISIYDMLKNNLFSPISFVYRTEVYKEIGRFDESLEVLEDWEFNLRFLSKYDIHIIEQPLANYHIRIAHSSLEESFKNTITSKKAIHEKYDTIIRNRYLRYDLDNKQCGLGVLMNLLKWSEGKMVRWMKKILKGRRG